MTKHKKTSGRGASRDREDSEARVERTDEPAKSPTLMERHGGIIVPLVLLGLVAAAVLVSFLMD